MRSRALFAWTLGALFLARATPAAAKPTFDEAHINGPGLGGRGVHIAGRAIAAMGESGIDLANGRVYAMADSIAELGLTAAELGPGYVVRYSFDLGRSKPPQIVRQELYPYAKGGPVTYTSPGQRQGGQLACRSPRAGTGAPQRSSISWWTRDCPRPIPWSLPTAHPTRTLRPPPGSGAGSPWRSRRSLRYRS